MSIFRTVIASQIIFTLGIVNLVSILAILFSCRVFPTSKILKPLTLNKPFQKFYKYHGYIWWIFWTSVIIHVIFAIGQLGIPF
jgi:hypothetical protein